MAFILIPYIVILSWGASFTGVVEYSGLVVTCRAVLRAYHSFVRILTGGAYCVGVPVVFALGGGGRAIKRLMSFERTVIVAIDEINVCCVSDNPPPKR